MASHRLIEDYLADLGRRLPPQVVDELADGLAETWHHHLAAGLPPTQAARTAIAEFGSVEQVTTAFVTQSPARRTARLLLATGPLVGACWGVSLAAAHAWTWPVAPAVAVAYGATLLAVVASLLASATSRRSYRTAQWGAAGSLGLIALDATMLAAVLLIAPTPAAPMLVAVPASLTRIGLTLRSLPRALAR
jgi:hypothetical protein